MTRKGFTLVEVLIALAILGVVLMGLMSLITGTLDFSAASVGTSDRLRELNDVTGYLGDNVRRSTEVLTSATVNGKACTIGDGANPCFSVVVPEADGGTIDKYLQLFYRVESRAGLPAAYKAADPWADANTHVILEYRRVLCDADASTSAPACSAQPPPAEPNVERAQWYLVMDGLTLEGNPEPFMYDPDTETFTFNLRVVDHRRGVTRHTPEDGAYVLTVTKRN